MDRTLELYIQAAKRLKLPFVYHEEYQGIEINLAGNRYIFRGGCTPFNDGASESIAVNKYCVNMMLDQNGLPVPDLLVAVSNASYQHGKWNLPLMTYPVVAKPLTNYHGNGKDVFCNIQDQKTLIEYLNTNVNKYDFINIEKFERGLTDYRVLVFYNKVIAVAKREPASVVGDGIHTLAELIELENDKRTKVTSIHLKEILIDEEVHTKLKEMNLSLNDIPKSHEKIILCYTCNDARGGNMIAMGANICRENAELAIRAAKILHLNIVGLDIICEDIMRPIKETRGFIIEANHNPGIQIHECTLEGDNISISEIYFKKLIRKHPISYAINYFREMTAPYQFYIRSIVAFCSLYGLSTLLKLGS